jgi:radical SAM protein with 4Fe4S-binding SPASM domain
MDEAKRTNGELRVDLLHQCTDGSDLEADCGETAAECLEAAPWVPLHKRSDEEIAASVVAGPIGPIVLQRNREIVLIARESQKWVRTNAEGKEILDRCNRINTVREIADELTLLYDIPHEVALASCINVIRGGLATGYLWDTGHKTRLDLWLHVTDACNMRCPFCFRGDPQPSLTHPEMTVEGWSRVLDGLRAFPAVKVTISGGEPTLFPDLEALLDVLNSKPNVSGIFLLTNGTGASVETYRRLATKVSTLQVSLDGARPETNDLIRGPGNFARVAALLRELQEAKIRNVMLAFTATRLNCQDMYKMIYVAEKYETGGLHVNRLTPMGRALPRLAEIDITAEEFRKEVHATVRHYQIMLGVRNKFSVAGEKTVPFVLDLAYGAINNLARPRCRTTCGLGNSLMSISAYGDVSPCSSLAVPGFVFGNVQDEPMQTIYSRMATEMRRLSVHSVPGCQGCEVQQLCAGGCRARAYHMSGDITAKDPLCDRDGILDLLFQIGPVEYVPHEISSQLSEAGVLSIGDDTDGQGLAALVGTRHDAPGRPAQGADVCLSKTDAPADK